MEGKKKKELTTIKYITTVTCRLCRDCNKKRKKRFYLFSLLFLMASVPFFIWGEYLELALVLVVGAITVAYLSGNKNEMEYLARQRYRNFREGKDELPTHPDIITLKEWNKFKEKNNKEEVKIII